MAWPRTCANAASVATAALAAGGITLAVLAPTPAALGILAVGLLVAPISAALGVVVARRQPRNVAGMLLALVGVTEAFTATKEIGWQVLAGRPDLQPGLAWLAAVLDESAWWVFTAVALVLLYFPDGQVPGRRWRWVAPVLVFCTAVEQVGGAFETGTFRPPLQHLHRPFGPTPGWLDPLGFAAFALLLALLVACAVAPIVRYRRSDQTRRAQIKWLALAGFGVPLYPVVCLAEIGVWGHPFWISQTLLVASALGIPVATAIAIVRYDLYDVDMAVAATVTWGLLTGAVLGIYGLSSFAAGLVLGRHSATAAAGATAVCALALSPLRGWVQRRVDRRLYPLRRAAFTALDALNRRTSAGDAQPEDLQRVLRAALRDPALRVGFRVPGTDGFVDGDSAPVEPGGGAPVVLGGTRIGVLVPGTGVASANLLRQVAGRAATLVEVVRLRLELARALNEVRSSRARLIQTGYRERRRLERDLHDGAQQRLVSLGMAIRLAQRHLDDGTVDVNGLLDQSVAELATAVAELREIAHGLRPGRLDDGLPAALNALVSTVPVAVDMEVCADQLPDDVATTAYYVVSEAVANAVKHAEAGQIRLRVTRSNNHISVQVSDDGRGGATLRPGSGLADRVAALGGRLKVDSPAGSGTVVEAVLPCAS